PRTIYESSEFRTDAIFRHERIYFRTNDHAPNWKLMAATYDEPAFADWTTLLPEQPNVLDDVTVTSTSLVATLREDVLTKLVAYDLQGARVRELRLPEFGSVTRMAYDLDADRAYATVASFTAPYREYGLDGKALAFALVWQDEPPLDLSQIVAERAYVPAPDGARIPVFIAHRRDMTKGRANPTLLHVYGGFDVSVEPFYLGS